MEKSYSYRLEPDKSICMHHTLTLDDTPTGVLHSHSEYEIFLLNSENAVFHVEGMHYKLNCGDIMIFNSKEFHRIEYDTSKPYERSVIMFGKEPLLPYTQDEFDVFKAFENRSPGIYNHIPADIAETENIYYYFDEIYKTFSEDKLGSALMIKSLLVQMLVKIGRAVNIAVRENDISKSDKKIGEILRFINENISSELSLDMLSEHFFISKYYLSHLFKQCTGYSVNRYITYKRILLANELINNGFSASSACEFVGYNDYSNFYRTYKKIMNCSPSRKT